MCSGNILRKWSGTVLAFSCWNVSEFSWANILPALSGTRIYTRHWGKFPGILYRWDIRVLAILNTASVRSCFQRYQSVNRRKWSSSSDDINNILPQNLTQSWGDSQMLQKMKCSFTTFEAPYLYSNCNGCNLQLQRWTHVFRARAWMVEHVWTRKNLTDVTANLDSKDRIAR